MIRLVSSLCVLALSWSAVAAEPLAENRHAARSDDQAAMMLPPDDGGDGGGGGDTPPPPSISGSEISLPIAKRAAYPLPWTAILNDRCYYNGYYYCADFWMRSAQQPSPPLDFGGGNFVYGVSEGRIVEENPIYGTPYSWGYLTIPINRPAQVLAHVNGYFEGFEPGLVRGSVKVSRPSGNVPVMLQLVLQRFDGTTWQNASAVRQVALGSTATIHELEAYLPPNVEVRLEMRTVSAANGGLFKANVELSMARLFGARCFPDFADPGKCI